MSNYIVKELLHFCNVSPKKSARLERGIISYYDLTFVLKGKMEYIINGSQITLFENDAMLIPPGTLRERPAGESRVHYVSFNFIPYDKDVLPCALIHKNAITKAIRALCEVFSEQHISQFYHSHEKTVNILNCILFELIDSHTLGTGNKTVRSALQYIDANLGCRLTVDDIAKAVHISHDHLAHSFKKELGRSVIDYVNERRMLLARNMISAHELSLTDISQALGYESYSYFSRVFKRYFGVSPMQYK